MPDPKRNFEAFRASLEQSGFRIVPKTAPWSPDYLGQVDEGNAGIYLLGWTGDYGDPDNFVGTFFQNPQKAWGTIAHPNQEVVDKLNEAETETDLDAREGLYQEANRLIMDWLPGVPYVHTKPALAFTANVQGYEPSPVSLESFASVTLEE
jgi:peptide/nickel transport system substrate-binding protein